MSSPFCQPFCGDVVHAQGGLHPDAVSYNILIDACGKAQQLSKAFAFYYEMRQAGLQAGVNTYTSLIVRRRLSPPLISPCLIRSVVP